MSGDIDLARQIGCAQSVISDAAIVGAIEYVEPADRVFGTLGRQIRLAPDAAFGNGLSLETLKVGDRVRVSGAPSPGPILASRVDAADLPDGHFIAGPLTGLDTVRKTFVVNGILVAYAGATLVGPMDALRDGSAVRVRGSSFGLEDEFPGSTVARPARVDVMSFGLSVHPSPAFVAIGSSLQFSASGVTGPVTWRVSNSSGSACDPKVCGAIDASGRYTAPSCELTGSILVTATSVSDPRVFASATVMVPQTPAVVAGSHTISGEVVGP